MNRAVELHKEGYNCAEAVLKAISEDKKLNISISAATPFGAGMSVGTTCGAITGALMAIGAIKGRETNEEKNIARLYAKEVMSRINEKYETFECKELKRKGVSCAEIIEYTYEVVKEYID